jgi:hypothetical protein
MMKLEAFSTIFHHPKIVSDSINPYRTKQEIEADYQRRKIVKKFRKRIQKFENSEMDAEMDLKKGILCST